MSISPHQVEHGREEHLLLDPRPPAETNALVLATMQKTGPMFWMTVLGSWAAMSLLLFVHLGDPDVQRPRHHRSEPLGDVGAVHRQPGLLHRYRPRRARSFRPRCA